MAEITDYPAIGINNLMTDIERYKYNPSAIQRRVLDYLRNVTEGKVDIVDPTNPFVFLLEASAVNTSAAINEASIVLRKQYPALAQTEEELYRHMTDKDFLTRFSTPAKTEFTFLIQYRHMLGKMVNDEINGYKKLVILPNTEFEINGLIFSLQYPIEIRYYPSKVLQIVYNNANPSPLQTLTTNIIKHEIRKDTSQIEWLYFNVEAHQFKIETVYAPIQASSTFHKEIQFTDKYYFCRVFQKTTATKNQWVDLKVTYTDQVYDPFTPTAVLKVLGNRLFVYIPQVYINQQLVDGNIRIDIYTTKGNINVNMANYNIKSFTTKFKAIDRERDVSTYSNAMNDTMCVAYNDKLVTGGSNGLNFKTVRELVINNAIGPYQLPITNVQLTSSEHISNFKIIKNVDVVTNRIFQATRKLPNPINPSLVTAANITVGTLVVNLEELAKLYNVANNQERLTMLSNAIFEDVNGVLALDKNSQYELIKSQSPLTIAEIVNKGSYLYCPYYYVFDNSLSEFEVRAYDLDRPVIDSFSFNEQNNTATAVVNTRNIKIEKVLTGYKIRVTTESDNFYIGLADDVVAAQLAYKPIGESEYAYLNAEYVGKVTTVNDKQERVFEFYIDSNHDIDNKDQLHLTSFKMFSNEYLVTKTNLRHEFRLFYTTSYIPPGFKSGPADKMLGDFLLPNSVVITYESFNIEFGKSLKQLWSQARSVLGGADYARYVEDVPQIYEEDVYDRDPETGAIFSVNENGELVYNLIHEKGDIVYNDGEIVYKHRKGDVIFDELGNPIVDTEFYTLRHVDLLLIEGSYFFATQPIYEIYRREIAKTVTRWCTQDLADINTKLLEQTKIYYYPQKLVGTISVKITNELTVTIEAAQSFNLELYVTSDVYKNTYIRQSLELSTVKYINEALKNRTISISDMVYGLKEIYGDNVISFNLTGLGGDKNYETVTIVNDSDSLSLKKKLVVKEDNSLAVVEDVNIKFIDYLV